jgi:hypothetical protein
MLLRGVCRTRRARRACFTAFPQALTRCWCRAIQGQFLGCPRWLGSRWAYTIGRFGVGHAESPAHGEALRSGSSTASWNSPVKDWIIGCLPPERRPRVLLPQADDLFSCCLCCVRMCSAQPSGQQLDVSRHLDSVGLSVCHPLSCHHDILPLP